MADDLDVATRARLPPPIPADPGRHQQAVARDGICKLIHPHVAQYCRLRHMSRAPDKPFRRDWALICHVRDGHITHYRFHEDTAERERALTPQRD